MRNLLCLLTLALVAVTGALAQTSKSASTDVVKPIKSFDLNAIDKSIDPCNDFYQYACGTWIKQNPIPPDQAAWGRFNELHQNNQIMLRNILEKQSADDSARNPT